MIVTVKLTSISGYWCRVATRSGNQEKSGKTKINDKSQEKMGVFEKKTGNLTKKVRFCQFKFTKFLIFKSFQMVKN